MIQLLQLLAAGVPVGSFTSIETAKEAAAVLVGNLPIEWTEPSIEEAGYLILKGDKVEGQYYPEVALFNFPFEILDNSLYGSVEDFSNNLLKDPEERDDEDDSDRKA